MTDRDDTRTTYVTKHPVRVLHLNEDCRLLGGAGSIREVKRNQYPNRRLCKACAGDVDYSAYNPTPIRHERNQVGEANLDELGECPWPGCGGDLEWAQNAGQYEPRCHACSRHPDDVPEDTPAWQTP